MNDADCLGFANRAGLLRPITEESLVEDELSLAAAIPPSRPPWPPWRSAAAPQVRKKGVPLDQTMQELDARIALARNPSVLDLDDGYRDMAADTARESEAQAWCRALAGTAD